MTHAEEKEELNKSISSLKLELAQEKIKIAEMERDAARKEADEAKREVISKSTAREAKLERDGVKGKAKKEVDEMHAAIKEAKREGCELKGEAKREAVDISQEQTPSSGSTVVSTDSESMPSSITHGMDNMNLNLAAE